MSDIAYTLRLAFLALTLLAGGCERFPADPRDSLEQALARGTLRVGVIHDPPWAIAAADAVPRGLEPGLLQEFAASRGLSVEWRRGGPERLFEALAAYELDVVVGGLTEANPWKREVGFSLPYFTARETVGGRPEERRHVMAVPRGENALLMALEDFLLREAPEEVVRKRLAGDSGR